MLRLLCEKCGNRMKADPANAGKQGTCPRCGHRVRVPGQRVAQQRVVVTLAELPLMATVVADPPAPSPPQRIEQRDNPYVSTARRHNDTQVVDGPPSHSAKLPNDDGNSGRALRMVARVSLAGSMFLPALVIGFGEPGGGSPVMLVVLPAMMFGALLLIPGPRPDKYSWEVPTLVHFFVYLSITIGATFSPFFGILPFRIHSLVPVCLLLVAARLALQCANRKRNTNECSAAAPSPIPTLAEPPLMATLVEESHAVPAVEGAMQRGNPYASTFVSSEVAVKVTSTSRSTFFVASESGIRVWCLLAGVLGLLFSAGALRSDTLPFATRLSSDVILFASLGILSSVFFVSVALAFPAFPQFCHWVVVVDTGLFIFTNLFYKNFAFAIGGGLFRLWVLWSMGRRVQERKDAPLHVVRDDVAGVCTADEPRARTAAFRQNSPTASLVCGIAAVAYPAFITGPICAVAAIALGIFGLNAPKRSRAVLGIAFGCVAILLFVGAAYMEYRTHTAIDDMLKSLKQ